MVLAGPNASTGSYARPSADLCRSGVEAVGSAQGIRSRLSMEPRGIFSMAVPAEVLAAALAEDVVAVARGPALSHPIAARSTVVACCTT